MHPSYNQQWIKNEINSRCCHKQLLNKLNLKTINSVYNNKEICMCLLLFTRDSFVNSGKQKVCRERFIMRIEFSIIIRFEMISSLLIFFINKDGQFIESYILQRCMHKACNWTLKESIFYMIGVIGVLYMIRKTRCAAAL